MGPSDQPYQMQLSHNWARSSPEIVFFSRWVRHHYPCIRISQGSRNSDRNVFSPSAQCTEAANKARRLTFTIWRSFQDLSKPAFVPLNGALVRPHLEYSMPACSPNPVADSNHLKRTQRLATRLVTGMRHLPYEERLLRLGPHSLQWRRLRTDLITTFKIFKGLLDINPNLFFLPPARRGLRGHL